MFYSHNHLDRADHLRKDAKTQNEMLKSTHSRLLPVWRGKLLVGGVKDNQLRMLSIPILEAAAAQTAKYIANQPAPQSGTHSTNHAPEIFLGLIEGHAVFAQSISDLDESELDAWVALAKKHTGNANNIRFEDLRVTGPAVPANDGALMAYARGLTYWHDTQLFCSSCGSALHSINAGHIKCCDNNDCHHQSFPRTDPAVIMLVTQAASDTSPALCLLGRNHAWPAGVYSTLAGFVEPGESLEQAVQREVLEEANISTDNVRYIASQPWPFPRSIMLGFEAQATSTSITCDATELEDAQWFSAEQLESFGTWGEDSPNNKLPRTDSIARYLIDRWIAEQKM